MNSMDVHLIQENLASQQQPVIQQMNKVTNFSSSLDNRILT